MTRPLLAVLALLLAACGTPDHRTVVTTESTTTTVDDTRGEASRVHLAALVTWAHATATTTTTTTVPAPPRDPFADVWLALARCESGVTNANTGNGYFGFFQFDLQTWRSVGGTGYPHHHSYEHQKALVQRLHARRGFQPWPKCSRLLGLR